MRTNTSDKIIDEKKSILVGDHSNIITVSNLTKRFGEIVAVDDISFEVRRGETFAFLGPNGAGKSTTIKMLTTLLHPTSGKIILNGHDPSHNKDGVRKSLGIVFQDPSLDEDLTTLENMQFHAVCYKIPKNVRAARIEEMLKFVELWDRRDDMVKTFSGGMKRRLEIARGLLHHPTILFLDEPTLGLDPQTRNHMWSYVKDINEKENMTVFFTTHYMEEADRVADRIAIIDHGKIIATGTSAELKKQTNSETLEDAFLSMTGHKIREEEATSLDRLRRMGQMWRGKRR
jgi:ABC-2 type transport system ATP-binding protein